MLLTPSKLGKVCIRNSGEVDASLHKSSDRKESSCIAINKDHEIGLA